jgi:hypothetical protein
MRGKGKFELARSGEHREEYDVAMECGEIPPARYSWDINTVYDRASAAYTSRRTPPRGGSNDYFFAHGVQHDFGRTVQVQLLQDVSTMSFNRVRA